MIMSLFDDLQFQPPDEFNDIRKKLGADTTTDKIDVSAGVYRDQKGDSYILPCVSHAKDLIHNYDPKGHDYNLCLGIPEFLKPASVIAVGKDAVDQGKVASCQTIGGTGACNLGGLFLSKSCGFKNFYLGTPAWPNYFPLVQQIDGNITTFNYYDPINKVIDFESFMNALESAPEYSIFILQLCCHNPTGTDLSMDQWLKVGELMLKRKLIPFFDSAYQGFASGSKEIDGEPVRKFIELGLEIIVAQSFSKSLGLYGERIGCLHVVVNDASKKNVTEDQLRYLFRAECSSSPAFPAKIVSRIANNIELNEEWDNDLKLIATRLQEVRKQLFTKLNILKTPGKWDHILTQKGLFWYSGLTEKQSNTLLDEYHIYLPKSGRVNIAGLNDSNIDAFVKAFDEVVRKY